jgi:hypothetical protein
VPWNQDGVLASGTRDTQLSLGETDHTATVRCVHAGFLVPSLTSVTRSPPHPDVRYSRIRFLGCIRFRAGGTITPPPPVCYSPQGGWLMLIQPIMRLAFAITGVQKKRRFCTSVLMALLAPNAYV